MEPAVVKGEYSWEDFKAEYYYDEEGEPPTDDEGEVVPFEPAEYLGFEPSALPGLLSGGDDGAEALDGVVDERTLDVDPEIDEDAFFSEVDGRTTIANRYDLEKAVGMEEKKYFEEIERYWVNKPYAFVVLFHSTRGNEKKYYLVEPYRNELERELEEFLTEKLRASIKYASEDVAAEGSEAERRSVIEEETRNLLNRYDLYSGPVEGSRSFVSELKSLVGMLDAEEDVEEGVEEIEGIAARPEPVVLAEDSKTLTQYQVEKLLYELNRDFIGYERIDGIKHDINVEDISCDGYNSPVFVYHTDYEQIISNVVHGEGQLDDFVVKLAQRSGKGISKRQPQVDATLPDGSRAQLTLGKEVSDHGTNYTIRQFKDVPFTPVDLINWKTFSLNEMAFLWLAIENNKSLIFAGGTASGKTTSLNAVSLFIPSNAKIVSIEDTREVELPQRNWIASVTRPSFGEDEKGDIDEFDLLEAALRQRPDYIVMGEVRGEEGRTLFQVMSTGHTTYTTFHADNVSEVLKRFTTAPINVSKTLFTALDLVSIQSSTRVRGNKVRRNRALTEINAYDAENDEINVGDVFQWEPERDEFRQIADSNTLEEIRFDRGWTHAELEREIFERRVVLAYLIRNGLNEYTQVAATLQAYIADSDTILTLIARDELEDSLQDLRAMESVLIDVDPEKEEMVPRPDPVEEVYEEAGEILEEADDDLLAEYRGEDAPEISFAIGATEERDVVVDEHDPDSDLRPEPSDEDDTTPESGEDGATLESDDDVGTPEADEDAAFGTGADSVEDSTGGVEGDEAESGDAGASEADEGGFVVEDADGESGESSQGGTDGEEE
ncbi:hypothetical protein GCM10009039_16170 [Halocalculus aciditolerans]|uniref:Secretion system protein E n=1 Tax=Halocalculus aciditolerans TaxID=1383812 RepID=A0A830FID0_9EURY|nr:hypothetical protein GCM10009039_16170 [Halocalculus aciditolerans]